MSFGDTGAQQSGDTSPFLVGPAGGPFGLLSAPLPGRQGGFRVQVTSSVVDGATAHRTDKTSRTVTRAARRQLLACGAQQRKIRLECGEKVDGALCVDTYRRAG